MSAGSTTEETYAVLGKDDYQVIQATGCIIPGQTLEVDRIVDNGDGTFNYYFESDVAPIGSTVHAGYPFNRFVKPTMPFIRDKDGKVISNAKLTISDIIVYFENSGPFEVKQTSRYRAIDAVHSNWVIPTANDPDDPEEKGIKSGLFRVTWGERSDWSGAAEE